MSLTQHAIELILYRALILDYTWEARLRIYNSEEDFLPPQNEPMPAGPPPPPPNTPVSSPPPTPPPTP
jgi:hypothetical protein